MLNYYRRFVPGLASVLVPLHSAVGGAGKSQKITWSQECQDAFSKAKSALCAAVLLNHPNPFSSTALTVDASNDAVGAELSQRSTGSSDIWKPVAFFSKKLTAPEKKYSAFDRELLAIYLAVKHFRHHLEGRRFTVFTDHKPPLLWPVMPTDRQDKRATFLILLNSPQMFSMSPENQMSSRMHFQGQSLPSGPLVLQWP